MTTFDYRAIDQCGKKCKGKVETDSARQARQILRERGMVILAVKQTAASGVMGAKEWQIFTHKKISSMDLTLITRQLATLIMASIPLEEALKAVAQQSEKKALIDLLGKVRNKVIEGHSFAEAVALFPQTFNSLYRAMITAGEACGLLGVVLNRLADHTEQSQRMKSKVTQALVYPMVLTLVAVIVVVVLLSVVVPKVVEQFVYMKQTLPFSTKALMVISEAVYYAGPWLLFILIGCSLFMRKWLQKDSRRVVFHRFLLRLPVSGRLSLGLNTARYARTLCILNSSGVSLLQAMYISASVLTNDHARSQLMIATERVREGGSLSSALAETGLFSPMMRHMILSGEHSGELNNMLERAADIQDNIFSNQISLILSLFEPLLIITMASIVMFIILAILQPILQLNNIMS